MNQGLPWAAGSSHPVEIWLNTPRLAREITKISLQYDVAGPEWDMSFLAFGSFGTSAGARIARAGWRIEQDYGKLKEELGLDHYEGRSWTGWHHHVTLVTLAYAFLQAERARLKKNFWCDIAGGEEAVPAHSH